MGRRSDDSMNWDGWIRQDTCTCIIVLVRALLRTCAASIYKYSNLIELPRCRDPSTCNSENFAERIFSKLGDWSVERGPEIVECGTGAAESFNARTLAVVVGCGWEEGREGSLASEVVEIAEIRSPRPGLGPGLLVGEVMQGDTYWRHSVLKYCTLHSGGGGGGGGGGV